MVRLEQFIGDFSVPIDGISTIPLTKASYEIEQPEVRKTDFSKSIRIPESKEVNEVFEHIFEYNADLQTFDPNKKTSYLLLGDGVPLINGFCQLNDVVDLDGLKHYVITAKGVIGDLYSSISEKLLTDIDFSDMDHIWSFANIQASWTPIIGTDYVYPMIRYGNKTNQDLWYVEDFKPAIFLKEYIDRIFADAGYTFTSVFLNSDRFKSLTIPQSSDVIKLSDAAIRNRQFLVERDSIQSTIAMANLTQIPGMGILIFNNDTIPFYNTSGVDYNTTTGIWDVNIAGNYTLKGFLKFRFSYVETSTLNTQFYNRQLAALSQAQVQFSIIVNRGGTDFIFDSILIYVTAEMTGEVLIPAYTSPQLQGSFTTADFKFEVGDEISIRANLFNVQSVASGNFNVEVNDTTLFLDPDSTFGVVCRDSSISPGDTMVMNSTVKEKIKQKELLNAVIKRFNLYLDYDVSNDKNVIIEPLIDYQTDESEDVSSWVDVSKERVIKPLGSLKNGRFLFQDKEDEDELNKIYQLRKEDTYGSKLVEVDNDFLTSEKVIETIFSPCPLWTSVRTTDRIISSISFPRDVGGYSTETANIKLLFWGGLLDTSYPWAIKEFSTIHPVVATYPYAGHLDNPFNPDFDLSWSVPKILFYDLSAGGLSDLIYTDKNCFNIYWKKHIEEIIDKNSKVLINFMILDSNRYNQLSFRKKYYIDGSFWRLVEITDFDAKNPSTTKCTWVKLNVHGVFVGTSQTGYGGTDSDFPDGDSLPTYGMIPIGGNGSGHDKSNLVYGEGNQMGRQSISNSDNVINGSGARQILTSGSDGAKILSNNVMVVNSPGKEATRPFESFVNGVFLEKQIEFTFADGQLGSFNTTPVQIIASPNADEYIKVTRAYARLTSSLQLGLGSALKIQTPAGIQIAATSGTFFDVLNNTEVLTINPELMNFADEIELFQSADMENFVGATLTLVVVYQIIKI